PKMVTGTIFPFGGDRSFGVAERVIRGGVVSKKGPLFNSTPTSSLKKFVAIKSGLLSPFTSPTATEVAFSPPDPYLTTVLKVPSPLPSRTPTTPPGPVGLPKLATTTSGLPSPLTSAMATETDTSPPEA